jgi:hypothetical protein
MNVPLHIAALLTALLGAAHSYLGERYVLGRLFRRGNLPDVFRNVEFTKRTIRLAWHVMTIFAIGFAALFAALASAGSNDMRTICTIVSATFALSGVLALVLTRARHLSWVVFFAIAALVWVAPH